jgi:hypothetical protein
MMELKIRYQRKLEKIPTPEFIVLYNGKEQYPDYKELKLSCAFKNVDGLKISNKSLPMELVVHVYNINHGRNPKILEKSKTLDDYSLFVEKVREYSKIDISLEKAIKDAIEYCIGHGILKPFLKDKGSEVINMLCTELSVEEIVEIKVNEAREDEREETQKDIARKMKTRGRPLEEIIEDTGLSPEEIEKL